ncbi:hypothetical protein AgCh_026124 [Apium graveolens]
MDGQPIGVEGLPVIFDSGTTYTYFSSRDYEALLSAAPHPLYKPSKDIVKCVDPFCALFRGSGDESIKVACGSPKEQCVTEVITHFSVSQNVIVRDLFHLKLTNGNTVIPRLALGCGFDQEVNGRDHPPYTDGVLGLRNRNTTILAQLHKLGLMQNKFSHCFSAQEGGYLVMGDNIFPSSGIVWAPMFSMSDFYTLGPAELQYDDQATGLEGLLVIFDSGSTYTHISYPAFGALFHMDRGYVCLGILYWPIELTNAVRIGAGKQGSRKMHLQRVVVLLYLVVRAQQCFPSSDQLQKQMNVNSQTGSSVILPVSGNVYPKGYYYATLNIGSPPRPYFLDIDTGSGVTWLQCDAPCIKCFPAPHALYKPSEDIVKCNDPFCALFHWPNQVPCECPEDQCYYEVKYADHGSSLGVLVKDLFPLKLTNGNTVLPYLAFGCGYDQEVANAPYTDGVLGLGEGKSTILAQLRNLGLMQNVFGHCFSARGGGYLFLENNILPSSGIVWVPMSSMSGENLYSLGPAELQFDGQTTGVEDLPVYFDSGSTYTYFSSLLYAALLDLAFGNVCLGILNGADVGLEGAIVIGGKKYISDFIF